MKSYLLRVELTQDEDGRWNAAVPSLKGCYTGGNTRGEALAYIQDSAKCCLEDMLKQGEPLPPEVEAKDDLATAVTLVREWS